MSLQDDDDDGPLVTTADEYHERDKNLQSRFDSFITTQIPLLDKHHPSHRLSDHADTTFNISFPLNCAVKQWYNYKALAYLSRLYPQRPRWNGANDTKVKYDQPAFHIHVFPYGMADEDPSDKGLPFSGPHGVLEHNFRKAAQIFISYPFLNDDDKVCAKAAVTNHSSLWVVCTWLDNNKFWCRRIVGGVTFICDLNGNTLVTYIAVENTHSPLKKQLKDWPVVELSLNIYRHHGDVSRADVINRPKQPKTNNNAKKKT